MGSILNHMGAYKGRTFPSLMEVCLLMNDQRRNFVEFGNRGRGPQAKGWKCPLKVGAN